MWVRKGRKTQAAQSHCKVTRRIKLVRVGGIYAVLDSGKVK